MGQLVPCEGVSPRPYTQQAWPFRPWPVQTQRYNAASSNCSCATNGEVAERLNAVVLKTIEGLNLPGFESLLSAKVPRPVTGRGFSNVVLPLVRVGMLCGYGHYF